MYLAKLSTSSSMKRGYIINRAPLGTTVWQSYEDTLQGLGKAAGA
jgi:hypothetical protein